MSRRVVLPVLVILLTGVIVFSANVRKVEASGTIYIRADGNVDPPTANVTTVDNVTYVFTDNIYDSVVVEKNSIVVDGAGYTVTGSGNGNGTELAGRNNVTVRNMTIKNFTCGICLFSSSNNTLSANNVTNNGYGVYLGSSSNNVLSGNDVTNNGEGIWLSSSSNSTLSGNNVTNNDDGIVLVSSSNNNVLSGNNVTANNYDGIYLFSSSDSTLSGNNVRANKFCGIYLDSSSSNVLSGNNVANNYEGIWLHFSSNSTLSGNVMGGNRYNFGVDGSALSDYLHSVDASNLVDGSPVYYFTNQSNMVVNADAYPEVGYLGFVNCANVTVQGLNLTSNGQGLLLAFTNDSRITGNNVASNLDGIVLVSYSNNDVLYGNNVAANNHTGVGLLFSSNSTLSSNNVADNGYGILLGSSSDDVFFHNTFLNNTQHVHVGNLVGANTWDDGYPSGGNYWSDYNGTDGNGDGIGDAPYVIDANNRDRYPLIASYGTFGAGTWNGTPCNVGVMTNSTFSGFQVDISQKTISFNVTGAEGSTGFCRVTIPNIIVQDLWQDNYTVLVDGEPWPFDNWTDTTNTYIYVNYTHSQHQIVIIPEIPYSLILPMIIIVTLLATIVARRKSSKHEAGPQQHLRTACNKRVNDKHVR